ncbi:hypothetical protein [Novosphingobium album (ex Liu et al. 2023)]|uniref:Uncharacterized protein n=1 Tax=Novosphingobium album (ex Liu et al. 2023) TaxID=3031130 RepID=A0ABT5WMC9_9SPHN|nr:hypothetical protein [Novosphingobium album (ex Liu et al. 2023)]MDE8651202.1 hypothetical protein [Novosphingobium album (ex Liu et al. 2023)]
MSEAILPEAVGLLRHVLAMLDEGQLHLPAVHVEHALHVLEVGQRGSPFGAGDGFDGADA